MKKSTDTTEVVIENEKETLTPTTLVPSEEKEVKEVKKEVSTKVSQFKINDLVRIKFPAEWSTGQPILNWASSRTFFVTGIEKDEYYRISVDRRDKKLKDELPLISGKFLEKTF